ncbi:MAG TPA: hypothetical protein PKL97_03455 [Candidatus Omnitrophota bacterium]|nr:hypothetical protein [Candidatus Omnitrophota bacterium]
MKRKILSVWMILALLFCGVPSAGMGEVVITATANATGSALSVSIMNGTAITGTYVSGSNNLSFSQYLEVKFSCGRDGYQAIIISTDNSNISANPKYTGGGSGSGLILTSNTATNAALHWVVFTDPVSGGYTFVPGSDPNAEPIKTSNQFFVADKKESPFPAGYASFVYDIDAFAGNLANAPDPGRSTVTGTIYIYLGANLKFMPAGTYKTSMLRIELVTINPDQTFVVHNRRTVTVTATR